MDICTECNDTHEIAASQPSKFKAPAIQSVNLSSRMQVKAEIEFRLSWKTCQSGSYVLYKI